MASQDTPYMGPHVLHARVQETMKMKTQVEEGFLYVKELAESAGRHAKGTPMIGRVKRMATEFAKAQERLVDHQKVLEDLEREVHSQPMAFNELDMRTVLDTRRGHTHEIPSDHSFLVQLHDVLASVGAGDDDGDDDQELTLVQVAIQLRCPLTQMPFKDPVKNTQCGHVYEKNAIYGLLRTKRSSVLCPVPGCGRHVHTNTLVSDPETKKRVRQHERRQATQEAHDSGDSISVE